MKNIVSVVCLFAVLHVNAQPLHPGFELREYLELMRVSVVSTKNADYIASHPKPQRFKMIYQSGSLGLDNSWDLWVDGRGYTVVSIRGTTSNNDSWLENFYAALIPAKGEITLNSEGDKFSYELTPDPRAGVHAGWMVATAFLANEIVPKLDSLYDADSGEIFIMGHSQGGGIAYLLTAYLKSLQVKGQLPAGMRIKMYSSAAPKPGNYFFAQHFEAITQNGWAYNVVNAADWVPQVPFSIQTMDDFNTTNPFRNAEAIINEQKFTDRVVLKHVFKKLDGPARKAQKNYEKYLGDMTSKMVVQRIPGLELPPFLPSNDYVRTGNTKILTPDSIYLMEYPDDSENIFAHHLHKQYTSLAERTDFGGDKNLIRTERPPVVRIPARQTPAEAKQTSFIMPLRLNETWALERIYDKAIQMEEGKVPYIEIKIKEGEFQGFGGCNQIRGNLYTAEQSIVFSDIAATRMHCGDANIEPLFVELLNNRFMWNFREGRLILALGDIDVMVFKKVD